MTYVKTLEVSESGDSLPDAYHMLHEMFGMVPKVISSMSLRPDLLAPIVLSVKRLRVWISRKKRPWKQSTLSRSSTPWTAWQTPRPRR